MGCMRVRACVFVPACVRTCTRVRLFVRMCACAPTSPPPPPLPPSPPHPLTPSLSQTESQIKYEAESPDEAALVVAAKVMGFFFYKRTATTLHVGAGVRSAHCALGLRSP